MMIKKPKKKRVKGPYYIDKKDFYIKLCEYLELVNEYEQNGLVLPMVPDSLARVLLTLCTKVGTMSRYRAYQYNDDMVSFAVEDCIRRIRRFNHIKYSDPFSYFSMIAINACQRYKKSELKALEIKISALELGAFMGYSRHPCDLEMYPDETGFDMSGEDWRDNFNRSG
jgi:hypothetical protein